MGKGNCSGFLDHDQVLGWPIVVIKEVPIGLHRRWENVFAPGEGITVLKSHSTHSPTPLLPLVLGFEPCSS